MFGCIEIAGQREGPSRDKCKELQLERKPQLDKDSGICFVSCIVLLLIALSQILRSDDTAPDGEIMTLPPLLITQFGVRSSVPPADS
ncbi:hypothetical protein LIER_12843 [Lithospermum erythrorhizon]|uniref:Uncharacterized protein n=1 Tax=Lithospermum erythrorhizon TaxID=34254 RepID=A0AAV3PWE6_LITER